MRSDREAIAQRELQVQQEVWINKNITKILKATARHNKNKTITTNDPRKTSERYRPLLTETNRSVHILNDHKIGIAYERSEEIKKKLKGVSGYLKKMDVYVKNKSGLYEFSHASYIKRITVSKLSDNNESSKTSLLREHEIWKLIQKQSNNEDQDTVCLYYGFNKKGEEIAYLEMPVMDGEDLFEYIKGKLDAHIKLPFPTRLKICLACVKAVKAFHELQGNNDERYVHYDIKPENLIIKENNGDFIANLVDFNFVKKHGDNMSTFQGTPEYASYRALKASTVSQSHDIESLARVCGIILYDFEYQNEFFFNRLIKPNHFAHEAEDLVLRYNNLLLPATILNDQEKTNLLEIAKTTLNGLKQLELKEDATADEMIEHFSKMIQKS